VEDGLLHFVDGRTHGETSAGIPHHLFGGIFHPYFETNITETTPSQRVQMTR